MFERQGSSWLVTPLGTYGSVAAVLNSIQKLDAPYAGTRRRVQTGTTPPTVNQAIHTAETRGKTLGSGGLQQGCNSSALRFR